MGGFSLEELVGKNRRWAVLQRDNFTCNYCGRSAPSVILHVDHIVPRIQGGGDELANLTTACIDCNEGKGGLRPDESHPILARQLEADVVIEQAIEGGPLRLTAEEIEAGRSIAGGWTRARLATWGVPWPPVRGWRQRLIKGEPQIQKVFIRDSK